MLGIEVNGEFLELGPNTKPQFERLSPIFQTEGVIKDDRTIPFSIPASDTNKRILGNPQVMEHLNTFTPRFTARLWWKGVPRILGQLRIDRVATKDRFEVYFAYGLTEIAADLRERSLRDIMNEQVVIHNTNFDKRIQLVYQGAASDFPGLEINGKPFSGNTLALLRDAINADTTLGATALIETLGTPPTTFYVFTIIPTGNELEVFNVNVDVEEIETATGTIERSVWSFFSSPFSSSYKTTYDNFILGYKGVTPNRKLRFNTYCNYHGTLEDNALKSFPIVNYFSFAGLALNVVIAEDPFRFGNIRPAKVVNNTSLAPQVTLRYVLERIETFYDITIKFPLLEDGIDIVLVSPNTLDVPLEYWNGQKLIFYRRSFNIAEFVPDMPVNEFLKALQSLGYYITYDSLTRTVTYHERNSVVADPDWIDMTGHHADLTDIVNVAKEGVTLKHLKDPDNVFTKEIKLFSDGSLDYVQGAGQRIVSSSVVIGDTSEPTPWPADMALGDLLTINQPPKENFPLQLAYQSNNFLSGWSWLSTWILDHSLGWESNFSLYTGLFEKLWNEWIIMEDNVPRAKVRLYVPEPWIWDPHWKRKILIDRTKYLIRSFTVVLESAELMVIDAEIQKVPYSVRSSIKPGAPILVPVPDPIPVNETPD